MASQYVLQDRTLATKWALFIDNGRIGYDSTLDAAQSEPIVEDDTNGGTYWKIFMDDGRLGIEETVTVQDDEVVLEDQTTAVDYILFVSNGRFGYKVYTVAGDWEFHSIRRGLYEGLLAGVG